MATLAGFLRGVGCEGIPRHGRFAARGRGLFDLGGARLVRGLGARGVRLHDAGLQELLAMKIDLLTLMATVDVLHPLTRDCF